MPDIDLMKLRRLDGSLLLVFRELLRTRRATETAARLGLSQSAISHALSRLRELFDDPLFVRRPHGFEPTKRAVALGPQVEALIALAGAAMTPDAAFDPEASRRRFDFAAPEFVTALIGASLINDLQSEAPGVTFAVTHAAEEDAYKALRRGEIDLALGRFGAPRPGYVTEPLFEDVYCVAARKDHPSVRGSISIADWRETGHVFAWAGSETSTESDGPFPDIVMRAAVPHWLTVLMLVAATDALATCPRRLVERHAGRLGLQVIDPPFEPSRIHVSAVRRAGHHDPGLDWFLERIRLAAVA